MTAKTIPAAAPYQRSSLPPMLADVDAPALLRMQAAFDLLDQADSMLTPRGKSADGTNFRRLLKRDEALVRLERAFALLPVQLRPRFNQWARESYERFYEDIKRTTMPSGSTT